MKKIILSLVVCMLLFALISCKGTASEKELISDKIGLSVEGGKVETYTDDHGGFLGDGETYAKITFSDETFLDKIKQNSEWSSLPLSENLNIIVYGGNRPNGDSWSSFIEDENEQLLIPTVSNGYYFFKDRHSESKNEKDDSELFDRHSMNFTLAIYDTDSKTLYFYVLDT